MQLSLNQIRGVFETPTRDLETFREIYVRREVDFIYDGHTKMFFIELISPNQDMVMHSDVLASLYAHRSGLPYQDQFKYPWADLYVEKGWGLYKSTSMHRILASPDFDLTGLDFLRRDIKHVP